MLWATSYQWGRWTKFFVRNCVLLIRMWLPINSTPQGRQGQWSGSVSSTWIGVMFFQKRAWPIIRATGDRCSQSRNNVHLVRWRRCPCQTYWKSWSNWSSLLGSHRTERVKSQDKMSLGQRLRQPQWADVMKIKQVVLNYQSNK